jgi:hypothetical protein
MWWFRKTRPGILFRLQIFCLTLACVGTACPHNCTTRAALVIKQDNATQLPLLSDGQHSLKGGESHSYRINLTAGQFLNALVEQQGIDVEVALFNPDGSPIAVTDSPNGRFGSEPIVLIAAASGEHRVEIRSPGPAKPASYQIRIQALREATPDDKHYVAAERAFEEAQKLRSQPAATDKRAAIKKYKEALPLFSAAGDSYRQALALQMIGLVHVQLNEFRIALPFVNEASLSLRRSKTNASKHPLRRWLEVLMMCWET